MSGVNRRKRIAKEASRATVMPVDGRFVAKVDAPAGNNLHEVFAAIPPRWERESVQVQRFLVSMPTKLRKSFYIKRGDYVLCQPIEEGDKVKAEIIFPLTADAMDEIKQEGLWPTTLDADHDPISGDKAVDLDGSKNAILCALDEEKISYNLFNHEPMHILEKMAALCRQNGGTFVKHVFLCDVKTCSNFYLFCTHPDADVDVEHFSRVSGCKLRLANDDDIRNGFGLAKSTFSMLILLCPSGSRFQNTISCFVDQSLMHSCDQSLYFPLCSTEQTVGLKIEDVSKLIECARFPCTMFLSS